MKRGGFRTVSSPCVTSGRLTSLHLDCSFGKWGEQRQASEDHEEPWSPQEVVCKCWLRFSSKNPSFTFCHSVKQKCMEIRELGRGQEERRWCEQAVGEVKERVIG